MDSIESGSLNPFLSISTDLGSDKNGNNNNNNNKNNNNNNNNNNYSDRSIDPNSKIVRRKNGDVITKRFLPLQFSSENTSPMRGKYASLLNIGDEIEMTENNEKNAIFVSTNPFDSPTDGMSPERKKEERRIPIVNNDNAVKVDIENLLNDKLVAIEGNSREAISCVRTDIQQKPCDDSRSSNITKSKFENDDNDNNNNNNNNNDDGNNNNNYHNNKNSNNNKNNDNSYSYNDNTNNTSLDKLGSRNPKIESQLSRHHPMSPFYFEFIAQKFFFLLASFYCVFFFWIIQFPQIFNFPSGDREKNSNLVSTLSCTFGLIITVCTGLWMFFIIKVQRHVFVFHMFSYHFYILFLFFCPHIFSLFSFFFFRFSFFQHISHQATYTTERALRRVRYRVSRFHQMFFRFLMTQLSVGVTAGLIYFVIEIRRLFIYWDDLKNGNSSLQNDNFNFQNQAQNSDGNSNQSRIYTYFLRGTTASLVRSPPQPYEPTGPGHVPFSSFPSSFSPSHSYPISSGIGLLTVSTSPGWDVVAAKWNLIRGEKHF
jgi:hypothetical protein